MDTRDTPEQAELRRSARQLAHELGPVTVAGLDDATRTKRLAAAVRDAGWLELRDDNGNGQPLAGGEEAAIVAEALGQYVADVAFTGPVLAGDLLRRAGLPNPGGAVAFAPTLDRPAVVSGTATGTPVSIVDGVVDDPAAYVLVPDGDGFRVGTLRVEACARQPAPPISRARLAVVASGASVETIAGNQRTLTHADLDAWTALGLALTSADLVGVMRGVLDVTVAYAAERRQYGVPVGSFQAVQHLLAEAHCLMEGSRERRAARGVGRRQPRPGRRARTPAASRRRTAPAPRAPCARPRCRCTAGSATRGSASRTCTCGARCCRRNGSATTRCSSPRWARTRSGASDGLS